MVVRERRRRHAQGSKPPGARVPRNLRSPCVHRRVSPDRSALGMALCGGAALAAVPPCHHLTVRDDEEGARHMRGGGGIRDRFSGGV